MTKPAGSGPGGEVVEIDAMDGMEWEQGQRTPQANDANLAALLKETVSAPDPAAPERSRNAPNAPNAPQRARARVSAPATSQRPRAGGAPASAARSTPPPRQVTQIGHLGSVSHLGPAVAPGPGRPLTPAPAGVARAGSPPVELAASSGVQPLPPPAERAVSSAGMEAFVPTREYPLPGADPQVPAPAELAVSSAGMAPLPLSFDDVTAGGPRRADPSPAPPPSAPSLNDILRAPQRPVRPDGMAPVVLPVVLPLRAPAESARNQAPLIAPEPPPSELPSEMVATPDAGERLASSAWRRLLLVMGGIAGCGALAIAVVVMTGGKSAEPVAAPPVDDHVASHAAPVRTAAATPAATPAPAGAPAPAAAPAPARPTAATLPAAAPPEAESEPPARRVSLALAPGGSGAAASQPGRRSRKLGGKKLVVDYSTRTTETPMPGLVAQPTEDPAIGLARTAYLSGNQQLFAGNADGAIRAYRESLSLYPGYVGGYRGLGLAYAQLGDTRNALEAFRMYVDTVPGAKDVALIKKRIARLQGK